MYRLKNKSTVCNNLVFFYHNKLNIALLLYKKKLYSITIMTVSLTQMNFVSKKEIIA